MKKTNNNILYFLKIYVLVVGILIFLGIISYIFKWKYLGFEVYYKFDLIGIVLVEIFSIFIVALIITILFYLIITKNFKKMSCMIDEVKKNGITSRMDRENSLEYFGVVSDSFNSMMEEIEKAFNRQKRFVQDASHELRTPLTILIGHLKMLKRWGKYDPDVFDKSIDILLEEVKRLTKLVNELLYLTKIEKEFESIVVNEYINITKIIDDIIYEFNILRDDIKFIFEHDSNIYLKILSEHFKQLIIIFVDNAIKYSEKDLKIIEIKAFIKEEKVYISIKDNGIGINEKDISKITNKFYRTDKSKEHNTGSGIGLSIAANIIKFYKGDLSVDSKISIGTEIIVSFNK